MIRIGLVVIVGAIVGSMAIAIYMYTQYQTNFIQVQSGELVTVGPVQYSVIFDGTHQGNKETQPENTFVKIRINAKNNSQDKQRLSGGQFYLIDENDQKHEAIYGVITSYSIHYTKLYDLIDENDQKHEAIYGDFSPEDLIDDVLEPGESATWTTQFDVPYDGQKQYDIVIRPTKQQSTVDTALICLTNC